MEKGFNLRSQILSRLSGSVGHRRLIILTYHRVLSDIDPMVPTEPTASIFERQLSWVSEFLDVIALPNAMQMIASGTLPTRAACITFDDGYRNNYEIAVPILERFRMPATFFIATGAVGRGAMWNDLIIESARCCGNRLDLRRYGLDEYLIHSDEERPNMANKVLDSMKYMPVDERFEQSREIYRAYAGNEDPALMMTKAMVRSLAEKGFDVGGHTVEHPILEKVPDERAVAEIQGCRDWLEQVTGRQPLTFAYPNGRPGIDFSAKHQTMVREAGFHCAVSTAWGCALPSSNPMSLPRLVPWETTRARYFARLCKTYAQSYR